MTSEQIGDYQRIIDALTKAQVESFHLNEILNLNGYI